MIEILVRLLNPPELIRHKRVVQTSHTDKIFFSIEARSDNDKPIIYRYNFNNIVSIIETMEEEEEDE
jgi:hypothetical protein